MGLEIGRELTDTGGQRYVIDKPLFNSDEARTRMGLVYLAHLVETPTQQCAIKIPNIKPDNSNEHYDRMLRLFQREIFFQKNLGAKGSPFAEFHGEFPDIAVDDCFGHFFRAPGFAMEYLPGRSLDQKNPPLPCEVFEVLKKVLSALAIVHEQKILLRDLKLEHIIVDGEVAVEQERIVTKDLVVKILDLGLAEDHLLVEDSGYYLAGTARYLPPELVVGPEGRNHYANPKRDLYAAGVIAYQLLTGRWPINGPDHIALMVNKTKQDPMSVGAWQLRKDRTRHPIPPELRDFTMKLLARDPEKRYRDATEALAALCNIDETNFIASQVAFDANAVIEDVT